jgi:hypothetical protein
VPATAAPTKLALVNSESSVLARQLVGEGVFAGLNELADHRMANKRIVVT